MFKVALIATLLLPLAGLGFMLWMFSIAPQGPEGLGPVMIGIIVFGLSIPFTIILLVIIATTSAISNRISKSGAQAGAEQISARPRQPEFDEDDEDAFVIPRPVFIGLVALATLPLLALIAAALGLF